MTGKDGSVRLRADCRELNVVSVKDVNPLLMIDDLLESEVAVFSRIDMRLRYC